MRPTDNSLKGQQGKLLRLFLESQYQWIPLHAILALGIAQYGTRIHELRHELHFRIGNKTRMVDGKRHSWFRLVPNERQQSLPLALTERHRDDG